MEKSIFVCAALSAALIACSQNPPQESTSPRVGIPAPGITTAWPGHCGGKKKHCILVTIDESGKRLEIYPHTKELRGQGHKLYWLLDDTDGFIFRATSIVFSPDTTQQSTDFPNCQVESKYVYSCEAANGSSKPKLHKYAITIFEETGPNSIVSDPFIVNR